ncbi:MAG: leucyl/phenylalanyl-tRNA--protein transferase [Steroidobacteraceae bacterium]|nr:leucyl/phenylalanyl-tRNA--protein transferase [Steroidobacteraceae bacterium]
MKRITWLSPAEDPDGFPDPEHALDEPPGLLAAGGDLSPARLLGAYRRGIFPWYSPGQPILWWAPDPREVLFPDRFRRSRSLSKAIRNRGFTVSFDSDFEAVIDGCAAPRGTGGTWITREMRAAYVTLHALGHAHSIEVRRGGALAGGCYGVALGALFFGESMFSRERDASKVALAALADSAPARGIGLIDCQLASPHLRSLGSEPLPRAQFTALLGQLGTAERPEHWT